MPTLTQTERQNLKAKAHVLKPVVMLGAKGLTEGVHDEIDRALFDHELIKIRIAGADHEARDELIDDICETHGAAMVQRVGNVAVLYKKRPE